MIYEVPCAKCGLLVGFDTDRHGGVYICICKGCQAKGWRLNGLSVERRLKVVEEEEENDGQDSDRVGTGR